MKKNKLIILCCLFAMISCNDFERKTINYIEQNVTDANDTIDMRRVLGMDYDSMYVFKGYSYSFISKVIGMPYHSIWTMNDEDERVFLFKGGKIVYEDDYDPRFLLFDRITEKLDSTTDCYLAYYGSLFTIKNNHGYYILEKVHESKPLYRQHNVHGIHYECIAE